MELLSTLITWYMHGGVLAVLGDSGRFLEYQFGYGVVSLLKLE